MTDTVAGVNTKRTLAMTQVIAHLFGPMSVPTQSTARLALLVALLVVVKTLFVLSIADVFFYGEELEKGTAAKAMLDGIGLRHHQLAYHYYEGGGFVISHLKALAFLVVGENILAHKLVALAICALILVTGYRVVQRHFGDSAALVFGLLFVFAPASFQKLMLVNLGIHFEATFFLLVVFDRTLRLLAPGRGLPRDALVLGLASGFGIYFSYQLAIVVGYVGLLLLWRRRDLFVGALAPRAWGGLVLGLLPLGVMALFVGRQLFDIHGTDLGATRDNADRIWRSLKSLYTDRSPLELASHVIYPFIGLSAFALGCLRTSAGRFNLRVLTGFFVLWFVVYANSSFANAEIYHDFVLLRFAPVWMVATVATAAVVGRGLAQRALIARAAFVALLALGMLHTVTIIGAGRPLEPGANLALLANTKGYTYEGYVPKILPHIDGDEHPLTTLLRFDEPDRELLLADLAAGYYSKPEPPFDVLFAELEALAPGELNAFLPGLGPTIALRVRGDLRAALNALLGFEGERRELLARAVGRFGTDWAVSKEILTRDIAAAADHPLRDAYWQGAGERVLRAFVLRPYGGKELVLNPDAARAFLRSQLPESVPSLVAGFDAALARYTLR